MTLTRIGATLRLTINATTDQLEVTTHFASSTSWDRVSGIGTIVFNNGTIWDAAMIQSLLQAGGGSPTAGDDVLTGTAGNDTIDGLAGNDQISGLGGDDTLIGGLGNDTLVGGLGNDTYSVDSASDVVTEAAAEGTDTIQSSVTYTLPVNVENLTLVGTTAINGTGNGVANTLIGNSGANTLDGGAGADSLQGGGGNDVYVVDDAGDVVVETAANGTDEVRAAISYTLTAEVENLTLTGTGNLNGTGNILANVIVGNVGNNTLDGGAGADTLSGGAGNDIYLIDNAGDTVVENLSAGIDEIRSSVTLVTLAANVENALLTGAGALNVTGNALDNVLTGNTGNNTISGGDGNDTLDGGSAGTDSLLGGLGNDIYIVDRSTGLTLTEGSAAGTDEVRASVGYTLGTDFENLTLTGTGNISGTGNTLANTLVGNSGNNTLDGLGGADTLRGGIGNDIYIVDNTGDVVTENAGEGTDEIRSSVAIAALAANVENALLTGTSALNATGNGLNNIITGNGGNNTLNGGAGNDRLDPGTAGTDILQGSTGDDVYVITRATGITVTENLAEGTDSVEASVTHTLAANVENLLLTGSAAINGTGNGLDNLITGNSGSNTLVGAAGNDRLDPGSAGTDVLQGGTGDDVYVLTRSTGITITENASEGIDRVEATVAATLGSNIEVLFLTGTAAINGTGNTLANLLRGNSGINVLAGGGGNDIIEGGVGADTLSNTAGKNLFNGGADNDTITGNSGNELFIGGTGNDTLTTGAGADIIAFNRGDGQDTVNASTTKDNTVALGGGILYADLLFKKTGNDLILVTGAAEQVTFKDYYLGSTNRSVDKLQVVLEGWSDYNAGSGNVLNNKKLATFNFGNLVAAFDAALVVTPTLTQWALTNALLANHLGGSDTAAIGGDLAYQYNRFGSLSNVSFTPAQSILANAAFGSSAQTLQALAALQDTSVRLS